MRKNFLHPQSNICLLDLFYFINLFLSNQVFYNKWAIKILKGVMLQHEHSDASHWRVFLQVSSPFSSIIAIFNRANKIWVETLLLPGKVRVIFLSFLSISTLFGVSPARHLMRMTKGHFWTMLFSTIVQRLPQNPSIRENKIAAATNITTLSPLSVLQRKTWYMFSVSATFDAAAPWWDQSLAFHTCRRSLCWLAARSGDVCFTGFSAGCSLRSLTGILLFYDLFYLFIISLVEWNTLKGIKD